jgi:tetratricopeptide (TPR) repeat protein
MAGIGVLYTWIVFLVELSAIRIQEPFVLYRSYLWAPGILIAAVALLSGIVSHRKALPAFAVVGAVLLVQANDRLVTFSKPVLLWEDAVAKLAAKPAPWGSRPLYNLGKAYLYDGQAEKAIEISERCAALYPSAFHCPFARGAIHLHFEQFDLALPYLTRALELRPKSGVTHHHVGVALENLGRVRDAAAEYRRAGELGFGAGRLQLRRLEESHGELLRVQKAGTAKR